MIGDRDDCRSMLDVLNKRKSFASVGTLTASLTETTCEDYSLLTLLLVVLLRNSPLGSFFDETLMFVYDQKCSVTSSLVYPRTLSDVT